MTIATLVAAALIAAGFALSAVSPWFFTLVGVGAFGPGLLREVGWLDDQDEFQREASRRAGYHAYLAAGLVSVGWIAWVRSAERSIKDAQELGTLFLVLLGFVWFFSSLLDYWGSQKMASRVLYLFGTLWLVFNILGNTGPEWNGVVPLLMQSLLALPFFGLALLSSRSPRVSGVLLLAAAAFFFWFFGLFRNDNLGIVTQGVVFVTFIGPLLGSGLALALERPEDED